MKTWKPSRFLVTTNSRMDSKISAVRGRDRGARHPEPWDENEAQHEIDRERAGVDQRADALLAQHVEQPLDRADRGARQQPDGENEHEMDSRR